MLRLFTLFFALFSLSSEAGPLVASRAKIETLPGGAWRRLADTNKDGRDDLILEFNENGRLTREETDSDGDGRLDTFTEYFADGRSLKRTVDETGERFEESVPADDHVRVLVYRKENGRPVFVNAYSRPLREEKDLVFDSATDCYRDPKVRSELAQIEALAPLLQEKFTRLFTPAKGGMLLSSFGVLVEKSCIKGLGGEKNTHRLIREAILEGVSCMLAHTSGIGAQQNLEKIAAHLANTKNPLKINCNEPTCWDGAVASATVNSTYSDHPAIALSPFEFKEFRKDENFFKGTIFHELLHTCGHNHGVGVEYSYSCDSCCYEKKDLTTDGWEASCRICGGKHSSAYESGYLADLVTWSKSHPYSYARKHTNRSVFTAVMEKRGQDPEKNLLLLQAFAQGEYAPLAATLYKERLLPLPLTHKWPAGLKQQLDKLASPDGPRDNQGSFATVMTELFRGRPDRAYELLRTRTFGDDPYEFTSYLQRITVDNAWAQVELAKQLRNLPDENRWQKIYDAANERFGIYLTKSDRIAHAKKNKCKNLWPPPGRSAR